MCGCKNDVEKRTLMQDWLVDRYEQLLVLACLQEMVQRKSTVYAYSLKTYRDQSPSTESHVHLK